MRRFRRCEGRLLCGLCCHIQSECEDARWPDRGVATCHWFRSLYGSQFCKFADLSAHVDQSPARGAVWRSRGGATRLDSAREESSWAQTRLCQVVPRKVTKISQTAPPNERGPLVRPLSQSCRVCVIVSFAFRGAHEKGGCLLCNLDGSMMRRKIQARYKIQTRTKP